MNNYYGIIYKATNKTNGKIYIGQTTLSLEKRQRQHMRDASKHNDMNIKFWNALLKYGIERFEWEIVGKHNSLDELNEAEKFFIQKYDSFKNGYNSTEGGEGMLGRRGELAPMYGKQHSKKSREKMSKSRSGPKHFRYGKHLSKEHKNKLSKSKKGTKVSEITKRKISKRLSGKNNSMYGRKHKESTKRKIGYANGGINSAWYGKKHSEETKRKISQAQLGENNHMYGRTGKNHPSFGKTLSESTKTKIGKANSRFWEVCFPNGNKKVIKNLKEFCREHDILYDTGLLYVANGKYKQYKGFKCRKIYEEIIICQNQFVL